jgi:shikimate kinase
VGGALASVIERVLLVGFMATGKSSVGRSLARQLGWRFRDFDLEIEKRVGMSVADFIRAEGEPAFRTLEGEVAEVLLRGDSVVLSSGGGWPCREGRMEGLPVGTRSIWLQARPEAILRRARRRPGTRPLLEVEDPEARVRTLLAEREPWYQKADWVEDSEGGSPREVADRIAQRVRLDRAQDAAGVESRR